ncbi:hypothetical protein L3556_12390 [Candidatus Synechococcus calcipolaris G9]|uniref:Uncharacterized protein n=2 Tax=Candidatus Synechococcus calcipolaris G9 TaxID=1497997 RepID=A0ABT6F1L3_9SYNE|nr:hypothetical protein [Candidatus Synechococcus calcipolaris]MDG2991722.1 hypothetical protein [Candidatus Synechococcus calcipolaris G9]MDG2991724.1 hypothetical protein [Candidatus Synechococcus calcipolaris G9]
MAQSNRGGYREGSGRPSNWNLKPITVIKIPLPIKEEVLEIAHQLDSLSEIDPSDRKEYETVTIPKTELQSLIKAIWSDPKINRDKRDQAAIRKALTILYDRLDSSYSRSNLNCAVYNKLSEKEQVDYALSLL